MLKYCLMALAVVALLVTDATATGGSFRRSTSVNVRASNFRGRSTVVRRSTTVRVRR